MSRPDIGEREVELINQVLRTPYLSVGPMIERFEHALACFSGTHHAVGVSSGTAGLHLCVRAAGIQDGDLVITTPFSFVASANVLLYERAIPIFVDIDERTGNIDPTLVVEAVQDLTRGGPAARRWLPSSLSSLATNPLPIKAILPVDAFGQPADMDPLLAVARRHNLTVIEDACEAMGTEYKGRKAGTLGDAGVFAFYPNKQITTGEGGMIITDRDDWDALFRSLRNQGRDVVDTWLNHTRLGYNYRMDELSAALGVAQTERISELLARREQVARSYSERLADVEGVQTPYIAPETTRMSWFVYVIRLAPDIDRRGLMAQLAEHGIPSRPYFTPIHLQPFYRERFGYRLGAFPVTERVAAASLAIPFYGGLDAQRIEYVVQSLRRCISAMRGGARPR
jgi:dTDP-4-amino-4,6-dideoxygalactose transaminase